MSRTFGRIFGFVLDLLLDLLLDFPLALAVTAAPNAQSPIAFTDVTTAIGIDWRQISRLRMGAGGAFLDYDGDGWQDVLLSGGGSTPTLYRNLNGTSFQRVENVAFPGSPGPNMRVAVGDIDNDGDPPYHHRMARQIARKAKSAHMHPARIEPDTPAAAMRLSAAPLS